VTYQASGGCPGEYAAAVRRPREAQQAHFTEMSRLRHETAVAKAPAIANHVADLLDAGEPKVAIRAHHHDVIDILRERLSGYGVVVITGETPQPERQNAVDVFQAPDGPRVLAVPEGTATPPMPPTVNFRGRSYGIESTDGLWSKPVTLQEGRWTKPLPCGGPSPR
jgi:hypothetical protein